MSTRLYGQAKPASATSLVSARSGMLQRKCACGSTPSPTGECTACRRKRQLGGTLQTKLRINQPSDPFEREADQVAKEVMGMSEPGLQRRVDEEEEKRPLEIKPVWQGRAGGDVRTQGEAPAIVHDVLRSPGQPLDPKTRAFMESRFGHDFSKVRVHTGSQAAESAWAVNALAYTVGQDMAFRAGRYAPGTSEGQWLLAHELTHVVQQTAGGGVADCTIQRQPVCGTSTPETTVNVYVVKLPGSSRNASSDVTTADTIWQQCGVRVNLSGGESWDTNLLDIDAPHGVLNAPASTTRQLTTEEIEMLSHQPGGSAIHAYYVPDFSGPKVAEAFWRSFHGTMAFAIGNSAVTEVFAHELGHVLLDTGAHEPNGTNVMARNIQSVGGHDLKCDQCP